jgi:hypothetical protein
MMNNLIKPHVMKKIILLLSLFIGVAASAQNDEAYVDELTQQFAQKLADRGISDYFTAKRYCSGKIEMFQIGREKKLCTSRGTYYEVYVVWKEEEQAFLKKIDNCGMFYSIELDDDALYDFYVTNKETLLSETVKNYKSASFTGTPELRKNPQPCFRGFGFPHDGAVVTKKYNLYELNEGNGDNLNYEYNSQLNIVALDAKLDEVLANSEATMRRQL